MKLKYDFVINEVAGQSVAVPAGAFGEFSGMIKLNAEAAYIFKLLKADITEEELVSKTAANFGCSEDDARANVEKIVSQLKGADLLVG